MKRWRTRHQRNRNPFTDRYERWIRMSRALRDPQTGETHWSLAENTCYATTKSLTWSVSIGRFGSETGSPGSFPGHCHPSSFFSPFFDLLDSRVQTFRSQMDLIHGISQWYFTSDRKMAAGVDSCRHHPAEQRRNTESTCQLRDTDHRFEETAWNT